MQAPTLTMCARLTSNQGIQEEERLLEKQMLGLDSNSLEYKYDQLQLQREQKELQIREENPNLDPLTLAGNKALEQLMAQDSSYQAIEQQIQAIIGASDSSTWGIPLGIPNK